MSANQTGSQSPTPGAPDWSLRILVALFVASGAAALVYEVVWFQLLALVLGSSPVSLGVLLGTFMAGMFLGSLVLPRAVPARFHPLRVLALLELCIGSIGIGLLWLIPAMASLYAGWGGAGPTGLTIRALFAGLCLLPPTIAMGATLPVAARSVSLTSRGVSWLGFLYTGNLAGAVCGCLLAGFYLLREHDTVVATSLAAATNATVSIIGFSLAGRVAYSPARPIAEGTHQTTDRAVTSSATLRPSRVHMAIALSGYCALAAQVIWTRQLGIVFGATVYAFSIIVASFLMGLGIGSGLASLLLQRVSSPRVALGWSQMLLAVAITYTGYMATAVLPYWSMGADELSNVWLVFLFDATRSVCVILPPTILWGASFPLALGSIGSRANDSARVTGGLYAANTLGAVLGALSSSLWLVAWLGTHGTQRLVVGISVLAGLLMLVPHSRRLARRSPALRMNRTAALAVVSLAAISVGQTIPPMPGLLVAYGRNAASYLGAEGDITYVAEGVHSSIAVSRLPDGTLLYHNAGKIQASSQTIDMRLQRMLGHLTTLVPRNPSSVLVIGCGAGVTAGAVSMDPAVEQVTLVEIEPLVPFAAAKYFSAYNHDVLHNPRVQLHIDDARHFLLTTEARFDAITSDPLDPWVKGAANLYTREFFELARRHLNPGGVITVFVQLYQTTPAAVKSELATFFEVFPDGTIFGNTRGGTGYDAVLLGRLDSSPIDLGQLELRLSRPEYATVSRSLADIGFGSATELFASYAGRGYDLGDWLLDAPINRDYNLRLQYLAGLGARRFDAESIYRDIERYRRFPTGLVTGPDALVEQFRRDMRPPL